MPRILNPCEDDICVLCGGQANFIAFNSKKKRCCETLQECPSYNKVTSKAQRSRDAKWIDDDSKIAHFRKMSKAGNSTLKVLHEDQDWLAAKGRSISDSIKKNGGRCGERNSMHGKTHNADAREKMKERASKRDNSKIGKYKRTPEHRDKLSMLMVDKNASGKLWRSRDTKPERMFESILLHLGLEYEKQFLIQFGKIGVDRFRHAYDFKLSHSNILIEIDGDYWHSLETVKARDKQCETVASSLGYVVIRFKQSYLESNYEDVVKELVHIQSNIHSPHLH